MREAANTAMRDYYAKERDEVGFVTLADGVALYRRRCVWTERP